MVLSLTPKNSKASNIVWGSRYASHWWATQWQTKRSTRQRRPPPSVMKELQGLLDHEHHHHMLCNSVQVITPSLVKGGGGHLTCDLGVVVPVHLGSMRSDRPDALHPLHGYINIGKLVSPLRMDNTHPPKGLLKRKHGTPCSFHCELIPFVLDLQLRGQQVFEDFSSRTFASRVERSWRREPTCACVALNRPCTSL